jgi:large subunit ribosomal protein L31
VKNGIHPKYHPVIFVDSGADLEFVSRSTITSNETRMVDGIEHQVVRLEISSASHPFYTGRQHFIDTAGRIDKFRRRYSTGK